MTEELRADAAGREYRPMARLARALYEQGLTTEQVLRECYGVEFPPEFYVFANANPYSLGLLADWTNQPWQMAIPLDRGGPDARADTLGPMERRLYDLDPDLLPLLYLVRGGVNTEDHGVVLCYRLSELKAGRPTVFGVRKEATSLGEVPRRGDSLLAALHEHHLGFLRETEEELAKFYKGEADFVDEIEVEQAQELLDQVEAFQHATDKRTSGSDQLEAFRAEAAGREYRPMARLARALYEQGLTTEQVLRECYGVEFPQEVFVLADANPNASDLLVDFANQPWQLAKPLDRGGPNARPDTFEPAERQLYDLDPDLLPLVTLVRDGFYTEDHGLWLCYRLTELEAGRPTVFGIRKEATSPDEVTRRGNTLLAALHEHHLRFLRKSEQELAKSSETHRRVFEEDMARAQELLDQIEAFQRATNERTTRG